MMESFFTVVSPESVFDHISRFAPVATEEVPLAEAGRRILGRDITCAVDIPGFDRAVMDGYAVYAASTFGAGEGNPAYLVLKEAVEMGRKPGFAVGAGEAAAVATGAMLPAGADSVVMKEHVRRIDDNLLEVYKPVAPGAHMAAADEDFKAGQTVLSAGTRLRAQEIGMLAAMGRDRVEVFKQPRIGIISSGDEIVPVETAPPPGCVRDINTFTLSAQVIDAGGIPVPLGIVRDDFDELYQKTAKAAAGCDQVLLTGGSSVGARDFTLRVIESLPQSAVLVHGIAMRPGKPTILADVGGKALWGLPGQVTSAMIVFTIIVKPFIEHVAGRNPPDGPDKRPLPAVTGRNIPSVYGRTDYVRVTVTIENGGYVARPVFGKSGLLNSMARADGLLRIEADTEGLPRGVPVDVILF